MSDIPSSPVNAESLVNKDESSKVREEMPQENKFPEEKEMYDDFKDITPYDRVIDDDWSSLWQYLQNDKHPTAYLIIYRFSDRYRGKPLLKNI